MGGHFSVGCCELIGSIFTRWSGLLLVRNLFVDVRPEFFHDNRHGIDAHLRGPHARSVAQGSIGGNELMRIARGAHESAFGVVAISRDCCRRRTAENFRGVELRVPAVAASHEDPAYCIAGAVEKTSVPG